MEVLGQIYDGGSGVPRDKEKAQTLWARAAELGHVPSQVRLGRAMLGDEAPRDGRTTRQDWLRHAAEQGNTDGQTYYGVSLINSVGDRPANPKEAREWLRKAANRGNYTAQVKLAICLEESEHCNIDEPPDYVEALKWVRLAIRYAPDDYPEKVEGWITESMSPGRIAEAEARVEAWLAEHPD